MVLAFSELPAILYREPLTDRTEKLGERCELCRDVLADLARGSPLLGTNPIVVDHHNGTLAILATTVKVQAHRIAARPRGDLEQPNVDEFPLSKEGPPS